MSTNFLIKKTLRSSLLHQTSRTLAAPAISSFRNPIQHATQQHQLNNYSTAVSTSTTSSSTTSTKQKKKLTRALARKILQSKRLNDAESGDVMTPETKRRIDANLEATFSKFSAENAPAMESYINKVPKNRFLLNSFIIGKSLSQSSNFTRYKIEAFNQRDVENCISHIKRKQNRLYKYLYKQIDVRLNSVIYEITRNYQAAHVPKLEGLLIPGGLLKPQANAFDRVRDNLPQGVPLSKLKEAFLLRAFQTYLLQTKHFSRVALPTRTTLTTVNKSYHVNKKSRDQFKLTSKKAVVVCSPYMKLFDGILQDELAFTGCRVKSVREEHVNHEV